MKLLKVILTTLALSASAKAAVIYDPDTHSLTINGQTTVYQFASVQRELTEHEIDTVFMYGPGGDYFAGLRIGRLPHEENVRVVIPRDRMCASACALSALAARDIAIDGEMLFHKPYTGRVATLATIEDIAAAHGDAYLQLAEYLMQIGRDMRLARRLVNDTNRCVWLRADAETPLDEMVIDDRCDEVIRPVTRPGY